MRFTIRTGSDPVAKADAALIAAIGLPGGGVVAIGKTHLAVMPGDVTAPADLEVGPLGRSNAEVEPGASVEATRANLSRAQRVILEDFGGFEARHVVRALQGRPVTTGDEVQLDAAYAPGEEGEPVRVRVVSVEPDGAALFAGSTSVATPGSHRIVGGEPGGTTAEGPTTAMALLAGLDEELETLTGWLALLTSADDLPTAWGLPRVAGVILEGPAGCGKSELVTAAADAAGAIVTEVAVDLVFKPERLIDLLERTVKETPTPAVVFVDRVDAIAGDDGMFRTQVAAIFRWFLDAAADRDRMAVVLGASETGAIDDGVAGSALLPRTLSIPPPDLERRRLLFEAALRRVPRDDLDYAALAARSAGFSGADILAAVVHASALAAGKDAPVGRDIMGSAIAGTTPSLGSVPGGEIPGYGFEAVANLEDVKQRLTEAVIWPITDPDRFARLGIDPPRGLLLHGPPGTGKTFVVRALANEAQAAFFSVKGAELLDKFVGESERGVREIFARARAAAPSIMFFDEIDALAPIRGRSTTSVTDSVVAALLTEMDGIGDRGDVVVIGATNRKDLVDPALLRGGRLESHLELGLPAEEGRRALIDISDVPFGDDVDLDGLASQTEGLSFADVEQVLREAALTALRRDPSALTVSRSDLDSALELRSR